MREENGRPSDATEFASRALEFWQRNNLWACGVQDGDRSDGHAARTFVRRLGGSPDSVVSCGEAESAGRRLSFWFADTGTVHGPALVIIGARGTCKLAAFSPLTSD